MRLAITALWLGGGFYGVYVYFKHRAYVENLPADPDNNALKRKHKSKLFWSLASIAIGITWAVSFVKK